MKQLIKPFLLMIFPLILGGIVYSFYAFGKSYHIGKLKYFSINEGLFPIDYYEALFYANLASPVLINIFYFFTFLFIGFLVYSLASFSVASLLFKRLPPLRKFINWLNLLDRKRKIDFLIKEVVEKKKIFADTDLGKLTSFIFKLACSLLGSLVILLLFWMFPLAFITDRGEKEGLTEGSLAKERWETFLKKPKECNEINECKKLPYLSFYVSPHFLEENKPMDKSKIKLYKGFVIHSNTKTIALYTEEGVLVLPLKEVRMKKIEFSPELLDKANESK